jgi:hypothetical protein
MLTASAHVIFKGIRSICKESNSITLRDSETIISREFFVVMNQLSPVSGYSFLLVITNFFSQKLSQILRTLGFYLVSAKNGSLFCQTNKIQ